VAVASAVILFGGLIAFVPYLLKQRFWLTSVAAATLENPLLSTTAFPLAGNQRACMNAVTVTHQSGIAAFELFPGARSEQTGPPLELLLSAPGYRAVARLPAGGYGARVEFQIAPPPHSLIGSACLINRGRTPVILEGTTDPRLTSRSALTIDGKQVVGNLTLTFLNRRMRSRLAGLGEYFEHVSNLTDRLVPVWLVWILFIVTLLAVPIVIVVAFGRAVSADYAVRRTGREAIAQTRADRGGG
jgi:hypothetical protein